VTGASRGIGAATALALARAGVGQLFLHYNSFREGAEQTLNSVRTAGANGSLLSARISALSRASTPSSTRCRVQSICW
jgi:NAD(P)-dependent dehydrogenase (short-subunit alcohol dehydrogenase family)